MRVTYARFVRHLPRAGVASQLQTQLVDLSQPGCADGFAIRQAAAIGVDRQASANVCLAFANHGFLLTITTEAVFGHVHDLGAGFGVLQLCDIDLFRSYTGHLVGGARRHHGW